MRPRSIVLFERLYWLNIAIAAVALVWTYGRIGRFAAAMPPDAPAFARSMMSVTIVGGAVVAIGIKLLIWFFIARRGSNTARWIFVIFFVLALAGVVQMIGLYQRGAMPPVSLGVWVSDILLRIACLWLLFRPDAAAWFRGERAPRDLHDTFS
ncbi:hypothetical protein DMC47_43935 [Nostoc sp. 3335mG]|nr:hypothetical protein DMC47_43935 [Nostoc sp. 3335mG]